MKTLNVLVLAIVLIVVTLGGILQFSGVVNFLSITPLSISNVEINDAGSRILVYARQGGGNELSIDFTPSRLNSFLESKGYKATTSSRLTAKFIENNIRIPFSTYESEYNTVKLLKSPQSLGFELQCSISTCKNKGYINTVASFGEGILTSFKCYCVEDYNNGYTLSFNSGFSSRAFKVEWNLDGQTKIMDSDSGYINFGSDAIIRWEGSLLGSNTIGVPNYDVFHIGSSWNLIDKNADSRISSAYSTYKNCVGQSQLTRSQYDSCQASYYNVVNNQLDSKNSNYKNEVPNVAGISFDYGLMNVDLKTPTFVPTYTIDLNANKVGIVRLIGKPNIVECPSDQLFSEAGSKNINFRIKNDGTTDAGFRAYTQCGNLISTNSQEFDIGSGETRSINLLLSGGNLGTTTNKGSCTLFVKDSNSNSQDSCSFNVEVEYKSGVSECVGSESTCSPDGKSIYRCEDGFFKQYNCNPGTVCSYSGGNAVCIIGSLPPLPDDEFNFNWLYLIPILLTLGVAGMFGWNGKNRRGNYYWLDFVIGGVLGLIVGLILYWVFSNWLVLLLIGVFGSAGMIGLVLLVGGVPLLIFIINVFSRGRVMKTRSDYRKFRGAY